MKLDVVSLEGKKVGSVELPTSVFGAEVRKDILLRVVNWQLAKRRAGTANTKGRSEIARTGSKFGRQKGGGTARHGSRRAPIFVGGGIVFGPKPRSFAVDLPKKVRRLGLVSALSAKAQDSKVIVLDAAKTASAKTKDMAASFAKLGLQNAVIIVDSHDRNFELATRNLPHIKVLPTEGANVYDIMRADTVVVTQTAVPMLEARVNR